MTSWLRAGLTALGLLVAAATYWKAFQAHYAPKAAEAARAQRKVAWCENIEERARFEGLEIPDDEIHDCAAARATAARSVWIEAAADTLNLPEVIGALVGNRFDFTIFALSTLLALYSARALLGDLAGAVAARRRRAEIDAGVARERAAALGWPTAAHEPRAGQLLPLAGPWPRVEEVH